MAFVSNGKPSSFKTESRRFTAGYGIVIRLDKELPTKYDVPVLGLGTHKGLELKGRVLAVLGARSDAPEVGAPVTVLVRRPDTREVIFEDLLKTNEGFQFLLEGVTGTGDALEARWAHGAGTNRQIKPLEIVGAPHVTFENPVPNDGPKKGWLHLNLDGSPTEFDVRTADGSFVTHELPFNEVSRRLGVALARNLKLKVSQRVLVPSQSVLVDDQSELERALTMFRDGGYTSCVVRTFIPGTTEARDVDVQVLSWPADIVGDGESQGTSYEMPALQETRRFVALRDGEALAHMEVIPGYTISLVGNSDTTKSTKHRFAQSIARGLTDGQKNMYATQNYGPGIAVSVVGEDGDVAGLSRLAIRTEGVQYRNLMTIPSRHFQEADKVKVEPARESQNEAAAA